MKEDSYEKIFCFAPGIGNSGNSGSNSGGDSAGGSSSGGSEKGLQVALCLSGAANDQGWNQTAYEGTVKVCEKYGCSLAYSENLGTADIAAAFADYAASGYDVIIGHGFEFGDPALEVAATYPDVKFICTEADASADNVASFVMACEQTAYVEGIIAANMSKSGKIGGIGPIQAPRNRKRTAKTINKSVDVITLRDQASQKELERLGYLEGRYNPGNHKTIHLSILEPAAALVADGPRAQQDFYSILFQYADPADAEAASRFLHCVSHNIRSYLESREKL